MIDSQEGESNSFANEPLQVVELESKPERVYSSIIKPDFEGKFISWRWLASFLKDYGAIATLIAIGVPVLINIGELKAEVKNIAKLREDVVEIRVLIEKQHAVSSIEIAKLYTGAKHVEARLDDFMTETKMLSKYLTENHDMLMRIDERLRQKLPLSD